MSAIPESAHVKAVAEARVHTAGRRAEKLLDRIPLPAAAQRTRNLPALLKPSGSKVPPLATTIVARQRFWKIRRSFASVRRFVKRHSAPGYAIDQGGAEYGGRLLDLGFGRGDASGCCYYFVSLMRSRGSTYVGASVKASWVYPRSSLEVAPADTREIAIDGANVDRRVTDPADVERIIRWFDTLEVVQPSYGAGGCPGPTGPAGPAAGPVNIAFTFRSAEGEPVATAIVPSEPGPTCWGLSIAVTIDGTSWRPLAVDRYGKYAFVNRVQRLLGVCFRDATRSCR